MLFALVIGAIIIVFSDDAALEAWSRFFRHPLDALSVSWQVVSESYRALFIGAFGDPTEIGSAIVSASLDQIQAALYPISEIDRDGDAAHLRRTVGRSRLPGGPVQHRGRGSGERRWTRCGGGGIGLAFLPGPLLSIVVIVAGFLGGAFWGFIPGILKAKTGAHEVITTIMLNFIAVSFLLYLLSTDFYKQQAEPVSKPVGVAYPHLFGSSLRCTWGSWSRSSSRWGSRGS